MKKRYSFTLVRRRLSCKIMEGINHVGGGKGIASAEDISLARGVSSASVLLTLILNLSLFFQ